ncbi:hypothetical protein AM588_10011190 [Phytophthora nicotianae]|uniref:Protein kinase domain-containing protein n=1 Tax=Phytophthora nicotianae TaxID=4792 RepID=A0A0W8DQP8_PHYNI|nr:hypothetical protein AM588_10011190 [Phytophthora nicotianae]
MGRKSALAELLADHRRQEATEEASAGTFDHAAPPPSSPLPVATSTSYERAAEAAQAQAFQPRSSSSHSRGRHERDAKYRMERVYEEVSRRKSQVIAGPVAPVDPLRPTVVPLLRPMHRFRRLQQRMKDFAVLTKRQQSLYRSMRNQIPFIFFYQDLKTGNDLEEARNGYKKDVDALTTLVGTPFWLAPEIIRSERYGPEADVYSFGIVLTELETRRTPYHDLEETGLKVLMRVAHKGLRPSLPSSCLPERRKLIQDCLRDTPVRRPTFAQVLSRLQGPVLLEIEGHVAAQPELERRVLLRRYQERRSL